MQGKLLLEDGAVFMGRFLGDENAVGEVVFNTSMTGYQEILTDPSYCRQIAVLELLVVTIEYGWDAAVNPGLYRWNCHW